MQNEGPGYIWVHHENRAGEAGRSELGTVNWTEDHGPILFVILGPHTQKFSSTIASFLDFG